MCMCLCVCVLHLDKMASEYTPVSKRDALLKYVRGVADYGIHFATGVTSRAATPLWRFTSLHLLLSHSDHDMRIRHDCESSRGEAEGVPRDFQMVEVAVASIVTVKPSVVFHA